MIAGTHAPLVLELGCGPAQVDRVPLGVVLGGADRNTVRGHEDMIRLRRLHDARVDIGGDGAAVRIERVHDLRVRVDRQIRKREGGAVGKHAGHFDDVDGLVVPMLGDQPHGIAGHRIVHDRGPVAEVVEIVPVEMEGRLGHAGGQIGIVNGNNLAMSAANDPEHI